MVSISWNFQGWGPCPLDMDHFSPNLASCDSYDAKIMMLKFRVCNFYRPPGGVFFSPILLWMWGPPSGEYSQKIGVGGPPSLRYGPKCNIVSCFVIVSFMIISFGPRVCLQHWPPGGVFFSNFTMDVGPPSGQYSPKNSVGGPSPLDISPNLASCVCLF